jgi:hypothetical protein
MSAPVSFVASVLSAHEALNADQVCALTGLSRSSVLFWLDRLVERGEVEILVPVGYSPGSDAEDRDIFYRRRRTGDGRHRWQVGLMPASRLAVR